MTIDISEKKIVTKKNKSKSEEVNYEKVEAIKNKIESGNLDMFGDLEQKKKSAERIAKKIIESDNKLS